MHQPSFAKIGVMLLSVVTLAACGSMDSGKARATAALAPTAAITPNATAGTASFTALDHGVRLAGEVRGLPPGTEHGFHIHEKGNCGDNGTASGGHFNPIGATHGKYGTTGTHAGELPSLIADAAGVARFSVELHGVSLTEGAADNVVGRALVVHRDRDDFTSQPAGNSGPRIACAVITRN